MSIAQRDGRVALVAGVARPPGIGRVTALRFAAAGADLVCAERVVAAPSDTGAATPELFARIVAEVDAAGPGQVHAVALSEADDWGRAVSEAVERFGRLDVCCALSGATGAQAGDGALLDVAPESWRRCLDANLTATFELLTAAARVLSDGGSLVALSSHAAQAPAAGVGALGAARAAVQHLVAVLAQELAPRGIRCNAVSPLAVRPTADFPNPGLVALAERDAGSLDAWLGRTVPLGRGQDADETAAAIEFLCSGAASFVSGVTVPVAGGAR